MSSLRINQIDAKPRLLQGDELDSVSGGAGDNCATWGGVNFELDGGKKLYIRYTTCGGVSTPLVTTY